MSEIQWRDRLETALEEVVRRWDDLRARYPESHWARRVDVVPPEVRAKVEAEAQT